MIAVATLIGWAGAAAAGGKSRFHRHEKDSEGEVTNHYSDRGAKAAKLVLPQLTLRSRSLLAKDGTMTVEVSTAPFDTGVTPLGNISRVRIDAIDPNARRNGNGNDDNDDDKNGKSSRFHKEYSNLRQGGYVTWKYLPGQPHSQMLRVDARAKGAVHRDEADGRMLHPVHYRPDLAVRDMAVPATAAPGTLVYMSANIIERMGDMGATADCVTLIDGAQVDITPKVWVAASGVVTCSMAASFAPGKHTVTVRVQNVHPGDYDDSNNEMSTSVDVQVPANLSYDAHANEHTTANSTVQDCYMTAASAAANVPEQHNTLSDFRSYDQTRTVTGSLPLAVSLPFSVSFKDTSGGNLLSQLSIDKPDMAVTPPDDPTTWTDQSSYMLDDLKGTVVNITRYFNSGTNVGSTVVSFQMSYTEANYHSEKWCKSSPNFACVGGDFTLVTDTPSSSGPKVVLANDYTVDLAINDGAPYSAHAQAQLTLYGSTTPTITGSCFNKMFPGQTTQGKQCTTTSVLDYGRDGEVLQ
jgi:hypothetical protein